MSDAHHESFRTPAEIRAFTRKLIALWERDRERPFDMKAEYANGAGPMIWSLTNHTVRLAQAVDILATDGVSLLVAVPLIRLCIDNAMTCAWLLVSDKAAGGLVHEGMRQRKAAIEGIVQRGVAGFDDSTLAEAIKELEEFTPMKLAEAQYIQRRFLALEDGAAMYDTYRIASSLSHAGAVLADSYLRTVPETQEFPLGVALDHNDELDNEESWLGITASMLTLALTACNQIDARGRMKTQLEKASKTLGVSMEIKRAVPVASGMEADDELDTGLSPAHLRALGEVAYFAANLENTVAALCAQLIDPIEERGTLVVAGMPFGSVVELAERLLKQSRGDQPSSVLSALKASSAAMEERNVLLHGLWSRNLLETYSANVTLTRRTKVVKRRAVTVQEVRRAAHDLETAGERMFVELLTLYSVDE